MKIKVFGFFLLVILFPAHSQYFLEEYHGYKKVIKGIEDQSYEVKKEKIEKISGELRIYSEGDNLFVGKTLIDSIDIVIEYNGRKYLLPYAKLLNKNILVDLEVFMCSEETHAWVLSLTGINDGYKPENYKLNKIFLIQIFADNLILTNFGLYYGGGKAIPSIEIKEIKDKDEVKYIKVNERVLKKSHGLFAPDFLFHYYDYHEDYVNRVVANLNLREKPGTDAKIIKVIKAGSVVKLIDISNFHQEINGFYSPWYYVEYSEYDESVKHIVYYKGWIYGAYIKY